MKRQHTYEKMMAQKLNGMAPPDVAGLWSNMESILDREMPQQEERKPRVGAWWFSANVLVAASVLMALGCAYTWKQLGASKPATNAEAMTAQPVAETPAKSNASSIVNSGGAATVETQSQKNVAVTVDGVEEGTALVKESAVAFAQYRPRKKAAAVQTKGNTASEETFRQDEQLADVPVQNSTVIVGETQPENDKTATVALQSEENHKVADKANIRIEEMPAVEIAHLEPATPAVFNKQEVKTITAEEIRKKVGAKKRAAIYLDKGASIGVTLNVPVAVAHQVRNELDMNGKSNKWQDYLPSVYAQLHLNKAFSVKAEWMPLTAQYTPNFTLYHNIDEPNPDEKEEKIVKLNKLFYTSVPVSVQYNTPLKNVSVSLGVQYSLLKKVILQDQEYYHVIGAGGWNVIERKNEVAVKDPAAVRDHNSGDIVDDVARSIRKEDWRLLSEVGYNYKGINAGLRYTRGLNNYVNSNFTNLAVKDRNNSLQVYLRYNIFDSRKK